MKTRKIIVGVLLILGLVAAGYLAVLAWANASSDVSQCFLRSQTVESPDALRVSDELLDEHPILLAAFANAGSSQPTEAQVECSAQSALYQDLKTLAGTENQLNYTLRHENATIQLELVLEIE